MDLLERIIPADETVLYEGRARGRPPVGPTVQGLAVVLGLGGCLAMAGTGIPIELGGLSVKIPAVVSLLVALGAVELFRFARWRSRRYVITTRRLLVIRGVFWPAVICALPRRGDERVLVSEGGVHVDHLGADLLLDGLPADEAANVREALATFDGAPPAPLPPPFWTGRRMAALALLLLLLLTGGAVLQAAPWRVTVEASWTPSGTGSDTVRLHVDGSSLGDARVGQLALWYAEADGALVGHDSSFVNNKGGVLLREAFHATAMSSYAVPTSAAVITVHGAVWLRAGGRQVPIALDVTPGRPATLDLRALLDAPPEAGPPKHGGKTLDEWVALLRADPNEHVRWVLTSVVAVEVGPGDAPAVPALIEALADPDQDVRSVACELLQALGPEARDAAPALRGVAERDPVQGVRATAERALDALGPK